MSSHIQLLVLASSVLVNVVVQVRGYPNGEGITTSCSSLTPGHGAQAQTTPSQYKITFSPTSYSPGSPVSVTLSSCTGTGFKGFMLQARRAEKNRNQTEIVGQFDATTGTRRTCSGDTALAHADSSIKTSLTFTWNPPPAAQGHIVFRATFVVEFSMYWVDVISDVLLDANISTQINPNDVITAATLDTRCSAGGSSSSEATTSMPATTNMKVIKDPACGVTKGCFSNCQSTSCSYIVSWRDEGDFGVYTLTAEVALITGAYVVLGFSDDNKMGGDSITGCASKDNGSVVLFNGQNIGATPSLFMDNNVTLDNHTNADGVLSCTFRRLKTASVDGVRVDISKPWTLLFARGQASVSPNDDVSLGYHGRTNRFISSASYKVADIVDSMGESPESPLVKAHGSLMVGAWILLSSVGIVAARYYKPVWKKLLFSQKVWFQIHRTCMILVLTATVVGFIIIFIEVRGWSELSEAEMHLRSHPIIGVIVTALTVLNPIMAIFRPHPDTPRRPIFNWAHWFVGSTAHILGVITIFFGVKLAKPDASCDVVYVLAAYVAWQVFVMLLLELISCYGRVRDRKDIYELHNDDGAEVNLPAVESPLSITVKRILFVAHVIIVAAFAIAVIVLIAE